MTVEAEPPVVETHINPDLCRVEARMDGAVAGFIHYEMRDGQVCFTLTELTRDFRSYRFAAALIRNVLDEAERRNLGVLPFCPLIRYFIATHFEYLPLVPVAQRRQFNLA
jgi:predicted GNAT family acetyltransferase